MNLDIRPFFNLAPGRTAAIALCLSGTGSNARVLLTRAAEPGACFRVAVLFTDAPDRCAAAELGAEYGVPVEALDIRRFYAENGEDDIRMTSVRRRELRQKWSCAVWERLRGYQVDFAVFAGFVPLNSLPEFLPCLNVHPGDLTVETDGCRRYAGLHYKPVETAILDGNEALRSSVILVQNYSGTGKNEVDAGPILGISAPVPIDRCGRSPDELRRIAAARTAPPCADQLREVAKTNLEALKLRGDHQVLPRVVAAFAQGRYGLDSSGNLYFRGGDSEWRPVRTVEFRADGAENPIRPPSAIRRSRNAVVRYLKWLYTRIVRSNGSPDYVARGWALGMFVGCTVPIFCQLIIAIPLSFVIRGSRIGAALGTFITTPPTAVFIYPVQIWVGNRLIGGALSFALIRDTARNMVQRGDWHAFAEMGRELVAAFFAGGLLWAAIMTPLTYFAVRFLVIRYRRLREMLMSRRRKDHRI
ncbi:MAG: DUF2062 domain-containing protein [Lentisphaeria bacterium]|nr:DUF2062 domain-containing protein [Lentisphaeria bacterium]